MNITIRRGDDGFGSQLLSILSGIAYSKINNHTYYHSPIENIKLVGNDINQNKEIPLINEFLDAFIKNLNIKYNTYDKYCIVRPFFHSEILENGEIYYNKNFTNYINSAYPLPKPEYYNNNKHNIAIHIRRGDDILEKDMAVRWIDSEVYDNIIEKIKIKYPNSQIHIFSWRDPKIKNKDNIIFHTSESGDTFLSDFNGLVWSDILIVGSSTFSIAAGLLNKNTVAIDNSIYKLKAMYIPKFWYETFKEIIND